MIKYDYLTYQNRMIDDLCELISLPTVNNDSPEPGMPFGKDVEKGFQWVKEKSAEFGFKITEYDGYALQADIGTGEHVIGMLCHVDVVPAGEGWDTDPFQANIKNGRIYGRGTVDDKGPLVCCFYAAKYMKDNGLIPADICLRMIVGGDEEREWKDIAYYCKHAKAPEISFAADGKFPLVFGEKGLIDFDYIWNLERDSKSTMKLIAFDGGMARNSVPANAIFSIRTDNAKALAKTIKNTADRLGYDITITVSDDKLNVSVKGRGCHAMSPEKGINAVSRAIRLMSELGSKLDCHAFVESYERYISEDYTGGLLGCACSDKESGLLTFNPGQIFMNDEKIQLRAGIRYPISSDYEKFAACIEEAAAEMACQ